MSKVKTISVEEFDRLFDDGDDRIDDYIDWNSGFRVNQVKRVNLDMPQHMIQRLDVQAKRRGVSRQALIKMWLADKLDSAA